MTTTSAQFVDSLILYEVNSTGKEIGRGAYGRVFEVVYEGSICAAKEVHSLLVQYAQDDELQKIKDDFLRECQIWSTLRHPSIVQFLGVYYPKLTVIPVIVMEKMKYSLRSLVEKHKDIPLHVKLSILDEVCLGLRYLHTRNPPIVHRDLTPNNILLSCFLQAKITDLGVAQALHTTTSRTMTKAPGTKHFMPPESLADRPAYGLPLDVFSFGGVILFAATELWPEPTEWVQFDPETGNKNVLNEVQRRQRYLDKMTGYAEDLKPLVISCLGDIPKKRPLVKDVSMAISRVKESFSQINSHDGKSVMEWLTEVHQLSSASHSRSQEAPLNFQLEKMMTSLKKENSALKEEIAQLAAKNQQPESKPGKIQWKEEGSPAPVGQSAHTAVFLDGKIYIGGGEKSYLVPLYQIDVYSISRDTWNSSIVTDNCFFALTSLGSHLLIVGGKDRSGKITNRISTLNDDLLKDYTKMRRPRCCTTAVGHQAMLLIVGGKSSVEVLASTELFDSTTEQWCVCDNLPRPHYWLQSVVVNNTVYVLGGFDEHGRYSSLVYTTTVNNSVHDLKWGFEMNIPWYRSTPGVVFDTCILLFGGVKSTRKGYVCNDNIYMLNVASHCWEVVDHIPSGTDAPSVVSIASDKVVIIGGVIYDGMADEIYTNTVQIGLCT